MIKAYNLTTARKNAAFVHREWRRKVSCYEVLENLDADVTNHPASQIWRALQTATRQCLSQKSGLQLQL